MMQFKTNDIFFFNFFFCHKKVDGVGETGHHLPMHERKKHRGEFYILKSSLVVLVSVRIFFYSTVCLIDDYRAAKCDAKKRIVN